MRKGAHRGGVPDRGRRRGGRSTPTSGRTGESCGRTTWCGVGERQLRSGCPRARERGRRPAGADDHLLVPLARFRDALDDQGDDVRLCWTWRGDGAGPDRGTPCSETCTPRRGSVTSSPPSPREAILVVAGRDPHVAGANRHGIGRRGHGLAGLTAARRRWRRCRPAHHVRPRRAPPAVGVRAGLALRVRGASPVQVGNAAAGQFQLDVWGEVLHGLYHARTAGMQALDTAWDLQRA
jgi:hypothetical protein